MWLSLKVEKKQTCLLWMCTHPPSKTNGWMDGWMDHTGLARQNIGRKAQYVSEAGGMNRDVYMYACCAVTSRVCVGWLRTATTRRVLCSAKAWGPCWTSWSPSTTTCNTTQPLHCACACVRACARTHTSMQLCAVHFLDATASTKVPPLSMLRLCVDPQTSLAPCPVWPAVLACAVLCTSPSPSRAAREL